MKKFIISESEKQRILEMHQNATSRQYLMEQVTGDTQAGGGGAKLSPFQQISQKWETAIPNSTLYGVFSKKTPKYNYLADGEIVVRILPNPVSKDLRMYLDNSNLMYLDYTYYCDDGGSHLHPPTSRDDEFSQKLYKKGDMPRVSVSDPNVKGMITDYCKYYYPKITPVVG
jgi:hypothetical protein